MSNMPRDNWKYIKIDEYTYSQIQKAIAEGKGKSQVDVMRKAIASYIGVRYKSPKEVEMELDVARIHRLAREARKEE